MKEGDCSGVKGTEDSPGLRGSPQGRASLGGVPSQGWGADLIETVQLQPIC